MHGPRVDCRAGRLLFRAAGRWQEVQGLWARRGSRNGVRSLPPSPWHRGRLAVQPAGAGWPLAARTGPADTLLRIMRRTTASVRICVLGLCMAMSACERPTAVVLTVDADRPIAPGCIAGLEQAIGPVDAFRTLARSEGSTAQEVSIERGRSEERRVGKE